MMSFPLQREFDWTVLTHLPLLLVKQEHLSYLFIDSL